MPKKLCFIEANTSGSGMLALQQASIWGFTPVFYTNRPERYHGLNEIACEVHVCDTNNLHILSEHLDNGSELSGIVTTSEFYIETVAHLAAQRGLPGNSPEAIQQARNKAQTRQVLATAHVLQPRFAIAQTQAEVEQALHTIGLPCIVKPADDSGSNHVLLCANTPQALTHAKYILDQHYNVRGQQTARTVLIEEYLEAPEFSVEILTWQGKHTCIGITQKSVTPPPFFVETGHLFPAPLSKTVQEHIYSTVIQAITAMNITTGATHTEVKLTKQGCAIIEINARLAGGMIPELIRLVTGVDMLEQHIRCAITGPHLPTSIPYHGTAGIHFIVAEKEGQLQTLSGQEQAHSIPGITQVTVTAHNQQRVRPPQNAYDRLGYIIGHTTNATAMQACLQQAHDCLTLDIQQ